MNKTVLLLEGDYTQCLPTARALHNLGYIVDGIFSDKWSYGYGSKFIRERFLFKDTADTKSYFDFILPIISSRQYDAIIPLNDESSTMLSTYQSELLCHTRYQLPDAVHYAKGYDKHQLMEVCALKRIPHPRTVIVEKCFIDMNRVATLEFPILIKPNYSSGSRGITLVDNIDDLEEKFVKVYDIYGECHLQEYIPQGGRQVKVQLYVNAAGELIQSSVIRKFRWYPEKGGASSCNMSIVDNDIVATCYDLCQTIGWVGFADFDTIEDPRTGELLIMELNPRLPACIKTAYASGIDWADVIVSEYIGIPHRSYSMNRQVYLRHLGFELLWFYYSKNRWSTNPSWFKFFGKDMYYQDMDGWDNPMPFIRGTFGNMIKQMSPEFRKSKSGTK